MKISFRRKENKNNENKKNKYKNSLIYLNEEDMVHRLGENIDKKFDNFTDLFTRKLFREKKFTPILLKAETKVLSLNDAQKILYFLIKQKKMAKELRILSPIINYDLYNKKLAEFNDPEISCIFIKIFGELHNDDKRLYSLFKKHLDIVYTSKSLELNAFVLSVLGDQIAFKSKEIVIESKDLESNIYLARRSLKRGDIDCKPHTSGILNSTNPKSEGDKEEAREIELLKNLREIDHLKNLRDQSKSNLNDLIKEI